MTGTHRRVRRTASLPLRTLPVVVLAVALGTCGGGPASGGTAGPLLPTATATVPASSVLATPTPTAIPTSPMTPTAAPVAATPTPPGGLAGKLVAVAEQVYPACGANQCGDANYTTCDGGFFEPATCPTTPRLEARFATICAAWVHDCPDMFGGGGDPVWSTESITADPNGTGGGVASVVLGYPGEADWDVDLVIVSSGGDLLVDDIYPTGDDPQTSDAYSGNWMPPHGGT